MTAHAATHRLLVNAILGQTSVLVRNALGGNWSAATAAVDRRRRMLGQLEKECLPGEEGSVTALRQAVEESERALARMGASHRNPPAGPSRALA